MKQPATSGSKFVGARHFLKYFREGQPEWALFAIKAPIGEVSDAFSRFRSAERQIPNVPLRQPAEDPDVAQVTAVVQVKDNPWTVVFRSLTDIDTIHIQRVPEEASRLSAELKTRAVTFMSEDTSGVMGYEIFENGESLTRWNDGQRSGSEFSEFPSAKQTEDTDTVVEQVFRSEGVYLPCCYPQGSGAEEWLVVEKISAKSIERADLIDIGESEIRRSGSIRPKKPVSPLTKVLYFLFLVCAAWLVYRCAVSGWTGLRIFLLSLAAYGFVICRGKWTTR